MGNIVIKKGTIKDLLKNKLLYNRVGSLLVLIVLFTLGVSIFYDSFLTPGNIKITLLNISLEAIVSVGMMILFISGVFDLSVGSMLGFSSALVGIFIGKMHFGVGSSIALTLLISISVGALTGYLVSYLKINFLIITLAMMAILRGIVLVTIHDGLSNFPTEFDSISSSKFLGLYVPVWYMIIIVLIFWFLMKYLPFFKRYYYIGGNEQSALYSGVNVKKMKMFAFMISAGLSSFAGIVLASKLGSSVPTLGQGMEMKAITNSIIGGASLTGGEGSILGVALGVLFMGLVNNFMAISNVPISIQNIVVSIILLIAVTLDTLLKRGRN